MPPACGFVATSRLPGLAAHYARRWRRRAIGRYFCVTIRQTLLRVRTWPTLLQTLSRADTVALLARGVCRGRGGCGLCNPGRFSKRRWLRAGSSGTGYSAFSPVAPAVTPEPDNREPTNSQPVASHQQRPTDGAEPSAEPNGTARRRRFGHPPQWLPPPHRPCPPRRQ
jgi:hypothetical protein